MSKTDHAQVNASIIERMRHTLRNNTHQLDYFREMTGKESTRDFERTILNTPSIPDLVEFAVRTKLCRETLSQLQEFDLATVKYNLLLELTNVCCSRTKSTDPYKNIIRAIQAQEISDLLQNGLVDS